MNGGCSVGGGCSVKRLCSAGGGGGGCCVCGQLKKYQIGDCSSSGDVSLASLCSRMIIG